MKRQLTPEQVRFGAWYVPWNGRMYHFFPGMDDMTACGKKLIARHGASWLNFRDRRCPVCDKLFKEATKTP